MIDLGLSALITAFILSWGVPLGVWWLLVYRPHYIQKTHFQRVAQSFMAFLLILSFVCLVACFVNDDFRLSTVANHSHSHMALFYKIAAAWGHHEGSMLLFIVILSLYGFSYQNTESWAWHWFLLGLFLCYLLMTSNPFERLDQWVIEGAELNPLLQDPLLMIHPPLLYAGYAGCMVPFCSVLASQFSHSFYSLKHLRQCVLVAWGFLTVGVTLGSFWAYYELGWGGWWFWDPVENASLLPWLMALALLHTLHGAKHHSWERGIIYLAYGTHGVALLGLFLVRSGLLSSVHSFAFDPKRGIFLLGIWVFTMALAALSLLKLPSSSPQKLTFQDRGLYYLIGIFLLITITLTLLLGTFYPLIIDAFDLPPLTVGAPYFIQTIVPMGLACLVPMACVLGFTWQPLPLFALYKRFQKFITLTLLLTLIIGIFLDHLPLKAWVGFLLCAWVLASIITRPTKWPLKLAHGGFALSLMGMCLDTGLKQENTLALKPGAHATLHDLTFELKHVTQGQENTYEFERAHVICHKNSERIVLFPEKRYYPNHKTLTTETALHTHYLSHIYIILGGVLPDGRWTLRVATHPWVCLIWLGAFIMALGAFMKSITLRRRKSY